MKDIEEVARKVDSLMQEVLTGSPEVQRLYDSSAHLLKAGGKRVRPYILVKSAEMLGGDREQAITFAAAIELLHTFTLIHDDIMDMSDMRRGVPSVHKVFGVPIAIIAGDLLFGTVFEVVSSSNLDPLLLKEISLELSRATRKICEGQFLDMALQGKLEHDDKVYYDIIERKTATLFEASAAIGGMVAGCQEVEMKLLRDFGRNLGIAFQITDDILGVLGDPEEMGKPSGDDIKLGKFTIMISHFCKSASKSEIEALARLFNNPNAREDELKSVVALLIKTGAVKHAEAMASLYTEKAVSALRQLPKNTACADLEMLANYMVRRRI